MSNLISGDFPTKTHRNINLGATGVLIKDAKSQIFSMVLCNTAASINYVKLYDKVTAPANTDTPTHTIALQANQTLSVSVGQGIEFVSGIGMRATTGVADNDNTSPAANAVIVDIHWL